MAAQILSDLAILRDVTGADPPTLTVPSRLRFASAEALDAFTLELTEEAVQGCADLPLAVGFRSSGATLRS